MFGLMVRAKKLQTEITNYTHLKKDYTFEDLIEPIKEDIKDYYWILDDVHFNHKAIDNSVFTDFEDKYNNIILEEKWNVRLGCQGFISSYAKFIIGDSDRIYSIKEQNYFKYYDEDSLQFIEKYVDIFFTCIDAAYWEVYCKDFELLKRIKKSFSCSFDCELKDSFY